MMARRKDSRVSSDSIDFFVSIMLRYPEIATIKYDPTRFRVKFTFIVSEIVLDREWRKFKDILIKSLKTYYQLEGKNLPDISIVNTTCDKITLVEISRDVISLCPNEIGIIVSLFKDHFDRVVVDTNEIVEEDPLLQEEIIRNTLESLKYTQLEKKLIALREEGRVLVFNK